MRQLEASTIRSNNPRDCAHTFEPCSMNGYDSLIMADISDKAQHTYPFCPFQEGKQLPSCACHRAVLSFHVELLTTSYRTNLRQSSYSNSACLFDRFRCNV